MIFHPILMIVMFDAKNFSKIIQLVKYPPVSSNVAGGWDIPEQSRWKIYRNGGFPSETLEASIPQIPHLSG